MTLLLCRYVEEYLAIGEAPEQVRNCFQQRSRWCKVSGDRLPVNAHPLFSAACLISENPPGEAVHPGAAVATKVQLPAGAAATLVRHELVLETCQSGS